MSKDDKNNSEIDIKVKIDAQNVNEYVAKAILESALGAEIEKALKEVVTETCGGGLYGSNPLKAAIEKEVSNTIHKFIHTEYKEQIKKHIRDHITEEVLADITSKAWEAFKDRY